MSVGFVILLGICWVFFFFFVYVCNVVDKLKSCKVFIFEGFFDEEFDKIEVIFGIIFFLDLKGIFYEVFFVGVGFFNW